MHVLFSHSKNRCFLSAPRAFTLRCRVRIEVALSSIFRVFSSLSHSGFLTEQTENLPHVFWLREGRWFLEDAACCFELELFPKLVSAEKGGQMYLDSCHKSCRAFLCLGDQRFHSLSGRLPKGIVDVPRIVAEESSASSAYLNKADRCETAMNEPALKLKVKKILPVFYPVKLDNWSLRM